MSQLAGAAWALRGWAIQDYAWERRKPKRYAQIDLCVEHRRLDLRFIAEAKQIWPCLTKPSSLTTLVNGAFQATAKELNRVGPDNWSRLMFVFIAPWTSTTKGPPSPVTDSRLGDFVSALRKFDGSAVWTFPRWARDHRIDYGTRATFYPGVALLAREL